MADVRFFAHQNGRHSGLQGRDACPDRRSEAFWRRRKRQFRSHPLLSSLSFKFHVCKWSQVRQAGRQAGRRKQNGPSGKRAARRTRSAESGGGGGGPATRQLGLRNCKAIPQKTIVAVLFQSFPPPLPPPLLFRLLLCSCQSAKPKPFFLSVSLSVFLPPSAPPSVSPTD